MAIIQSTYTKNILLISGLIFSLLFAFNGSFNKLALIWEYSNTYGHGFLILPTTLWLIHRKKNELALIDTQPSSLGLVFVGLTSLFWFVSVVSYINVLEQFALFSLFIVLTWAVFGWKVVFFLRFPLAFLYFSIPIGDFLIPYLQFVTADISVYMIKILGIPVFRDGMYIQIPNGNFVVAEACSGIRFLISTITIGVLYSYLNFTKLYKQILFVFICCAVAIIGNGLRAFLIILIGHLSDMKAAVGFDHLVYGWVFFAFILGLIFVIGHYMSDPIIESEESQANQNKKVKQKFPSLIFIIFTLLVLFIGPLLKYKYEKNVSLLTEQIDEISLTSTNFKDIPKFDNNWIPSFPRADEIYISKSTSDNVEIFIAKYYAETDDKEIISYQNRFFDEDLWSLKSISSHEITDISDNNIPYTSLSIVNIQGKERTIRVTYKVNNMLSANKIEFKLLQLTNKIMMTDFGGEVIVLSSPDQSKADSDLDKLMYEGFMKIKQHTILIE